MIFFVESPLTGSGLTALARAVAEGFDAALVTTDPAKYRGAPGAEVLDLLAARERLYAVATTEGEDVPAALLTAASRSGARPVGVICLTDRHLLFAAALAQAVGAPFTPVEVVRTFRDKRLARGLYEKLGIPSPRWTEPADAEEAAAFARRTGGPVVLKNCRGTGSLDVERCATPEETAAAFRRLAASDRYLAGEIMAEEYVAGPLYSLETLVAGGRCLHLGTTDRQLGPGPSFCEVSYTFPVALPARADAALREITETLVDACGIPQAMLHTEFVLTPGGPVVVEVNARLGGGLLPLMMSDCLSVSVPELLCAAALELPPPPVTHNGSHSSTVTLYPAAAGRLQGTTGLAEAAHDPFVAQVVATAAPGDPVRPAGDYRGSVGQIRTVADTANLALNAALAAARGVVTDVV